MLHKDEEGVLCGFGMRFIVGLLSDPVPSIDDRYLYV
jgi:hypothetical protein